MSWRPAAFCWPAVACRSVEPRKPAQIAGDEALVFPTGALTSDQVRGLLQVLPVDVTFVDADDRVRYFSEGPARIFARSRAILGRKVQRCHPPPASESWSRS